MCFGDTLCSLDGRAPGAPPLTWPDNEFDGFQPILRAIDSGNPGIVQLMLKHGADPNWYSYEEAAIKSSKGHK